MCVRTCIIEATKGNLLNGKMITRDCFNEEKCTRIFFRHAGPARGGGEEGKVKAIVIKIPKTLKKSSFPDFLAIPNNILKPFQEHI